MLANGARFPSGQAQPEARRLGLTVSDVRTFVMNAGGDENYVFVKIYTDQGITGVGEATLPSKALTISSAILEHMRKIRRSM